MHIVCTIGDCNGIGLEVWTKAISALRHHRRFQRVKWSLIGNPDSIAEYAHACRLPLRVAGDTVELNAMQVRLIPCRTYAPIRWGYPDPAAARQAWEALEIALTLSHTGDADGIVTLPITKHALHQIGWHYAGQTEFLASPYTDRTPIMLFVAGNLRIALFTTHIPLRRVHSALTPEALSSFVHRLREGLALDFGLEQPRIALLGLNPHAGEEGDLGTEELLIKPALERLRREGYAVEGPFAADAFFGRRRWRHYDVVIAMYHDQGLIPFKLLAQNRGVNVTLGLPFVRTSPDHGSAYDIAGSGTANPGSMKRALLLAAELVQRRYAAGALPWKAVTTAEVP
jgi:4-hydroxythreonine-4-phosphate dehydrogenase